MEKIEKMNSTTSCVDNSKDEELLLEKLTQTNNWEWVFALHKYKGLWCPTRLVLPLVSIEKINLSFQSNYENINDFIILATLPKSGTTWLKSSNF